MIDLEIFYADDDLDDIEIFADVIKNLEERDSKKILLNLYNSGEDMLNKLKRVKPKNPIIFLDINMPRKNGFEVLEVLRHHESFKNCPIIMLSTSSDELTINKAHVLGANLYAIKPSSFVTLKNIIDKVIKTDWTKFNTRLKDFIVTG